MYDKSTKSLFAGDASGQIVQFKRNDKNDSFRLVKNYGNVRINEVFSSVQVGGYANFAGYGGLMVVIDICKGQIYQIKQKKSFYAYERHESLPSFELKGLPICWGENPDPTSSLSQILDVTKLYKKQKKDIIQNFKESNHTQSFCSQKDRTNELKNLKIG